MPHYTKYEMLDDLVALYQEAAPTAVVYSGYAITGDFKKWPAMLRSDAADGKTYGFIIRYAGSPQAEERMGGVQSNRSFRFKIIGMHWQDDESNQELDFMTDTDKVLQLFDRATSTLTLPASLKLHDTMSEEEPIQATHGNEALILYFAELTVSQC